MNDELYENDGTEKEFDFSKARPNPYYEKLTQELTLRIRKDAIKYFEEIAEKKNMPLDRVISIYLCECMENKHEPHFSWENG